MRKAIEVPIPHASAIYRTLRTIHFSDAFQISLHLQGLDPQYIYEAIFSHIPNWVKVLINIRKLIAMLLGLSHIEPATIQKDGVRKYQVGQRVGPFTIQLNEDDELIAGDNDKHLDFRVSIFRSSVDGVELATVSTVVEIHNIVGKIYLFAIKPFHRIIVRTMLENAVNDGHL